jgi:hypothetical protein
MRCAKPHSSFATQSRRLGWVGSSEPVRIVRSSAYASATDHAMQTLGARAGTSRAMIALSRPMCGARVSDLQELALTYVVQQVLGLPSHR